MENNLENRVSMYYKVREFFSNNLAVLAASAPALNANVGTYNTNFTTLENLLMITEVDNTGYAQQKQNSRNAMRDLALAIGGAVYAHAKITNNAQLAGKAYTTKSTLDKKRDAEVLLWCEILNTLATPIAAQLVPLGIPAATLSAYSIAIVAFRNYIQEPNDKRSEGKAALEEAYKQCDVIDNYLKIIDGIMMAISPIQALLYNQYLADRLIDDNAGGVGSPDVIEIIEAGNLENIFTAPYLPSRSYKLKNTGTMPVSWGLSSDAINPTNSLSILNGGDTSIKLSNTLAPDGDFLIVKNTNASDITVELTVFE